jgi:C1A family cysteine protease
MRQFDLRKQQSTIKDQGVRPTCLACAATSGHEYLRGDNHSLSVEYLHWACLKADGVSSEGVSLGTAIRALIDIGQPYEELWPYRQDVNDMSVDYKPPNVISQSNCFRVKSGNQVIPIIEDLKWQLRAGKAVLIGIRLFYGFHNSENGRIRMPEKGEPTCGRHVVLLVGYDDEEQYFIFKNSWGNVWGDHGYGFLPYTYLKEHTLVAYTLFN